MVSRATVAISGVKCTKIGSRQLLGLPGLVMPVLPRQRRGRRLWPAVQEMQLSEQTYPRQTTAPLVLVARGDVPALEEAQCARSRAAARRRPASSSDFPGQGRDDGC